MAAGWLGMAAGRAEETIDGNWPSFRGPGAQGIAQGPPAPTHWDVPAGQNVVWKTGIPGLGHASPVIWDSRVFTVTAISGQENPTLRVGLYGEIAPVQDDTEHRWLLLAHDKRTGKLLWEREIHKGVPRIKRHTKGTHANATPATDGRHVVVMLGSEGLHCYSVDGEHLWSKNLGVLDSGYYVVPPAQWGFGSSPVIADGRVFVQCDVQKDSFLAAFALGDGQEVWRTPRDEVPTWSTPTVYHGAGRDQILCNGYKHIGGYELSTGRELWRMRGAGDIPVPTPVVANGLAFVASAHGMAAPFYAIRLDAEGDISLTGEEKSNRGIAWSTMKNGAYMQTPLVLGDLVYSCTDRGVLSCYRVDSGERVYRERIGDGAGGFTASPVACAGHLYFASEEGEVHVIQAGPEFREIARNALGEVCMATPAISGGVIFFRTQGHLVAIGHPPAAGR